MRSSCSLYAFIVGSLFAHSLFSVHSSFVFQPSFKRSLFVYTVHCTFSICFVLALSSNKVESFLWLLLYAEATSQVKIYIIKHILVGIHAEYVGPRFGSEDVIWPKAKARANSHSRSQNLFLHSAYIPARMLYIIHIYSILVL